MDAADVFLSRATRPLVVSDIDGTLNFFAESMCAALNARFGLSILASEMTTYRIEDTLTREQGQWLAAQFGKGSFYANAVPRADAIAALHAMHGDGYRVMVSTDRPVTTKQTTEQWIQRVGVPNDGVNVDPGGKQRLLAACGPGSPGLLIDDAPKYWALARDGVEVWSPRHPYTPANWRDYPNVWVFDSWAQVIDRLGIPGGMWPI